MKTDHITIMRKHAKLLIEKEIAAIYDATRDETDKATVKANLARIARLKGEL